MDVSASPLSKAPGVIAVRCPSILPLACSTWTSANYIQSLGKSRSSWDNRQYFGVGSVTRECESRGRSAVTSSSSSWSEGVSSTQEGRKNAGSRKHMGQSAVFVFWCLATNDEPAIKLICKSGYFRTPTRIRLYIGPIYW